LVVTSLHLWKSHQLCITETVLIGRREEQLAANMANPDHAAAVRALLTSTALSELLK